MERLLLGMSYRDVHQGCRISPVVSSLMETETKISVLFFSFFEIVTDGVNELHMIYNSFVYFLLL